MWILSEMKVSWIVAWFSNAAASAVSCRSRAMPSSAGRSGEPTARLTVGKQLAKNWTVTVSTNLSSNREIGAMFLGELFKNRMGYAVGVFNGGSKLPAVHPTASPTTPGTNSQGTPLPGGR